MSNFLKRAVKILHIADMHNRHKGRLFYSTGKKINNGFVKNNYNVLQISDRDYLQSNIFNYKKPFFLSYINKTIKNFSPDIILFGHVDSLNKDDFFPIGKRLTPKEKDQFWLMGNKALVFDSKPSRIYPQKNLFSHILGQTDDINEGISGIEKFFDLELSNKEKINVPLRLTLDSNLQHIIREELINAELNFHNAGSGAVLMDVESGEILSLISFQFEFKFNVISPRSNV